MVNQQIGQAFAPALNWRCIGPPRGGRVVAVAGHPTELMTFYFGAVGGGVWKTNDGGTYWENISDGYFTSAAIGALAVAEADPNVIYAGAGESTIRLDVSYGDGVYKSTDGGRTWANVGLRDTMHIAKIRVHPRNPDRVYVAAFGHAFGPNEERGVFRSQDGGKSWEKLLFKSAQTGAIDLDMDMTNPRILYAALWQAQRSFWSLSSGGPESGLYKSMDGGDSWVELTNNRGLPGGLKGKIGVTVSPANPNRVWAIIEAEGDKAGVYRSENGGATWEQVSNNRDLIQRPWYYCHIFADPQDPDTLYINNLKMWKSIDGGKTFSEITTPHGDNHDLWIDPRNPQRMINGNDGGACVSFNGGATWSTIYNQLTAQFYHLDTDNRYPYHVYGTQQDNSSIAVPSATEKGGIPWTDCYAAGTGESGYIATHPTDPNIVYVGAVGSSPGGGGALQRYDHRTKQIRLVTVWPELYTGWGARDMKFRFPWTFPICFSPHDPSLLYTCGNHVFRTRDEGSSWEILSPDLTRNDPDKLAPSGGPLTLDTSGAEHYCTISAFVESPHESGILWAGSDDGLIHLSRDNGATWQNVTPLDLPAWSFVCTIELSAYDPATVYIAATRYKLDDYQPYLYKSSDYGKSWQRIDGSFPVYQGRPQISRVIRADPVRAGLLFVGTETGLYVSFNDGGSWERLEGNLPVTPIYDLLIRDSDLVVATHGRSFWVLDDLTPLRIVDSATLESAIFLCPPRPTTRLTLGWSVDMFRGPGKNYSMGLGATITFIEDKGANNESLRKVLDGGENPPRGVLVYYYLQEAPTQPLLLTFRDNNGNEIRRFTNKSEATSKDELTLPTNIGFNRFVWDMRYPDAVKALGDVTTEKATTGPRVAPGRFQVQLTLGDQSQTQLFEIVADPRVSATPEDLQAQFALWQQITQKVVDTHTGINKIRRIRQQIDEWVKRAENNIQLVEMATSLKERLATIEAELVQTEAKSAGDRLRLPSRLNTKLIGLISVVACADARPPQQAYAVFEQLARQADEQLALLDGILGDDLVAFNDLVRAASIPAVIV